MNSPFLRFAAKVSRISREVLAAKRSFISPLIGTSSPNRVSGWR